MTTTQVPVLKSFKAQAASAHTNVKKDDAFKIPPEDLMEEPGFNERDYSSPNVIAQIRKFADAYKAGRFVPPVIVRIDPSNGNRYMVEGHLRRKGALLAISEGASLKNLTCFPFRGNDADRVACMVNSAEGLKLSPVGIARGYLKLYNMLGDIKEVAAYVHRTTNQVEAMMLLAEASTEVQRMVDSNKVSASTAIEVIRSHGDKAAEKLKELYVEAQSSGKTKVKPSAFREWIPPRKQSTVIYASIGQMVKSLESQGVPESIIKAEDGVDPQSLAGQVVSVDASVLVQLLQAFNQAEKLKAKRTGTGTDATPESDSDSSKADEQAA